MAISLNMTKAETPVNAGAPSSSKISKKRKKDDQGEEKAPPKQVKTEDLSRDGEVKEEIDVSKTVVEDKKKAVARDKGKGVAREEEEEEEEETEEMKRFVQELKEMQKGIAVPVTIIDVLG